MTRDIYAWARGGGAARRTAPGAGRTSGVKVGNLSYLYQGSQCVHQVNPFFKFNPKYDKGVVINYGEGGATKREGGAREVLPLRKGGAEKVLAILKGGAQKVLG